MSLRDQAAGVLSAWRTRLWPLKVLLDDIDRAGLFKQAEAMAYTTLFSLVPSLAVVFTLISLFVPFLGEHGAIMNKVHGFILQNLAAGSGEQAVQYLTKFIANLDIKKIGISSFAFLIATLILLLRQIEMALNRIWQVRKMRHVVVRFIYFWTFLTLGVFAGAILVGAASAVHLDSLMVLLGIKSEVYASTSLFGAFLKSFATWFGIFAFFFLMFKVVPNTQVSVKEAAGGALLSSVLFHQGGRLYGIYITGFSKYASVYGALAAVPVFLMWLYLSWVIILLGALVAWRIQQGLPKRASEESFTEATSSLDRLRNTHIQSVLPLIVLLTIYDKFKSGDGTGLSRGQLVHSLKLPVPWIEDSLEVLEDKKLVVQSKSAEAGETSKNAAYFPTMPAGSLQQKRVIEELLEGAQAWIARWQHQLPFDPQTKITSLLKTSGFNAAKLGDRSIAEL